MYCYRCSHERVSCGCVYSLVRWICMLNMKKQLRTVQSLKWLISCKNIFQLKMLSAIHRLVAESIYVSSKKWNNRVCNKIVCSLRAIFNCNHIIYLTWAHILPCRWFLYLNASSVERFHVQFSVWKKKQTTKVPNLVINLVPTTLDQHN